MPFSALGFHKPIQLSEEINPELIQRYCFGKALSLNDPILLRKKFETFVDQFAEKASLYKQALFELNKDFSSEKFIQRVLEQAKASSLQERPASFQKRQFLGSSAASD